MNRNLTFAAAVAAFALAVPALADKAPDFAVKDETGKEHKLADFAGKPVAFVWVNPGSVKGDDLAGGCPFVMDRSKGGSFNAVSDKVKAAGGVFVAVNSSKFNTAEASKGVAEKFKQTYPTLIDTDGKMGKAFGAKTTPHAIVVGKDGEIVFNGALNDNKGMDAANAAGDAKAIDYVTAAVTAAAAGKKPEITTSQPWGCSVKY